MKLSKKAKATILLTLFLGVLSGSFFFQLNHRTESVKNIQIVKCLEEEQQQFVVRVNEIEKEGLSQRVLEFFNNHLVLILHSSLYTLQVVSFPLHVKLNRADYHLFISNRSILV